jgi:hypothetical protein
LSQPEYLPWFARKLKVMVQEKRDVTMMVGKASGSSWLDASRKLAMREIEGDTDARVSIFPFKMLGSTS